MFVAIRFFVQALCFMSGFSSLDTGQLERFKAAVYEHAVIMPENRMVVVNRSQALELMYANLESYAEQVFMAKKQGAHIIVFPEDGIYGFGYTWESIRPYLEYIPDPLEIDWTPCDNPTRYRNTEVQYMLSCLAKENDNYLVANMGDLQPCNDMVSSSCRPMTEGEAYFHYNTDVAFYPQGQLISSLLGLTFKVNTTVVEWQIQGTCSFAAEEMLFGYITIVGV